MSNTATLGLEGIICWAILMPMILAGLCKGAKGINSFNFSGKIEKNIVTVNQLLLSEFRRQFLVEKMALYKHFLKKLKVGTDI